jgi:hypothetical protein
MMQDVLNMKNVLRQLWVVYTSIKIINIFLTERKRKIILIDVFLYVP